MSFSKCLGDQTDLEIRGGNDVVDSDCSVSAKIVRMVVSVFECAVLLVSSKENNTVPSYSFDSSNQHAKHNASKFMTSLDISNSDVDLIIRVLTKA